MTPAATIRGTSVDISTPAEWVIGLSTGLAAAGYLYSKIVRPLAKTLVKVEEATPVLASIAHEFRNNSGSTLKDHMDKAREEVAGVAHNAAQTRTALGLYISANDKRLTQIEESLNTLTDAVVALGTPKPRRARKPAGAAVEASD